MMIRTSLLTALFLLLSALATPAMAQKTPDFASYPGLDELVSDLAEAWQDDPEAFERMDRLRERFPQAFVQARSGRVDLRRVVPRDEILFLPLIFSLASDTPFVFGMDLQMYRSWRVSLIQLIAEYGDERSASYLMTRVSLDEPHGLARERAAAAVAALGSAEWIEALIQRAEEVPALQQAVVPGLGEARRLEAAEYLLAVANGGDDEIRLRALRALGDWGNQYFWATSDGDEHRDEWEKARPAIVDQLLSSYPQAGDAEQVEIWKTLQLTGSALSAEAARERAGRLPAGVERDELQSLAQRLDRSRLP